MSYTATAKKVRANTPDFLKKIIKVIVTAAAFVLVVPTLLRWMRNAVISQNSKELQDTANNPEQLQTALNDITSNTAIQNAARAIYDAFGFSKPWWNWNSWIEDDERVYMQIVAVTNGRLTGDTYARLSECYYYISAGRDLSADINGLLDHEYLKLLKWS